MTPLSGTFFQNCQNPFPWFYKDEKSDKAYQTLRHSDNCECVLKCGLICDVFRMFSAVLKGVL